MHRYPILCTLGLALALPGTLSMAGDSQADKAAGPYYNLGGFHRDATTESDAAQVWFDRGLAMCYAFNHEEAVRLDDALNYDEPWGWMQPARHALGALLLEQGNYADAEAVYQADLKRHPKNVWALHGLSESLDKQHRLAEADAIRVSFDSAVVRADIKVDRSCYCRVNDLTVQQ